MNCPQCGNIVKEGAKFCPVCGSQISEQSFEENQEQQEARQETQQTTYQQTYQAPPVVQPAMSSGLSDVQANKGYAVLSYLGILFLIPYFTRKNSEYAQYHAKQGMSLFIASAACSVVSFVLDSVFGMMSGFLGVFLVGIVGFLQTCVSVGVLVLAIIGIVNAVQGKMNPLPLIGKLSLKK
ncbi:MAG: zinc ribbon domain-containing protein [Bacteroidales bacterium]|nr:zinc ribbon domain-containing protein [Bacteroidales bacterium]